jgi:hypothetical protein
MRIVRGVAERGRATWVEALSDLPCPYQGRERIGMREIRGSFGDVIEGGIAGGEE